MANAPESGPLLDADCRPCHRFHGKRKVLPCIHNQTVIGVETNFRLVIGGGSVLLMMPKIPYEAVDPHGIIQAGVGVRIMRDRMLPEVGFQFIREF